MKKILYIFLFSFLTASVHAQFTQQGSKLVGTGNVGQANQGSSVALSSDGNTALVGGFNDNSVGGVGAVWVFTRSGTTWTQQGNQLVITGRINNQTTGVNKIPLSLSSDGNTALVGDYSDNSNQGAVWILTRSSTTWAQQKLVGTGNIGAANQGHSVALSSDGNTALVGGAGDNSYQGAVWVFKRSGTTWTQQGNKLVGTGNIGAANQGFSVALSSDGNTALVGGDGDQRDAAIGAVWVFTRLGETWTQQGSKLVGTGYIRSLQGFSVALSSDGNTALVGGTRDNSGQGGVWVFKRSGVTWGQQGSKLVGTGSTGSWEINQGYSVALSSDGKTALVGGYNDNSGQGAAWVFYDNKALSVEEANNKLKVYPNPVTYVLTVETDTIARDGANSDFQILNLLGQIVLKGGVSAQKINVSTLPEGAYILKIGTKQVKFIKQE